RVALSATGVRGRVPQSACAGRERCGASRITSLECVPIRPGLDALRARARLVRDDPWRRDAARRFRLRLGRTRARTTSGGRGDPRAASSDPCGRIDVHLGGFAGRAFSGGAFPHWFRTCHVASRDLGARLTVARDEPPAHPRPRRAYRAALGARFEVDGRYLGPGYGEPSAPGRQAEALWQRLGLPALDGTYSAKAAARVLVGLRAREAGPVLFWSTKSSVPLPNTGAAEASLGSAPLRIRAWLARAEQVLSRDPAR